MKLKISTLIIGAIAVVAASSSRAEEISFVCYDEVLQAKGKYESKGAVRYIPVELVFDTISQTVRRPDWDCSVVLWGDPNIFFTCSRYGHNNRYTLMANVFNRNTARFSGEGVNELNFSDVFNDFEPGEMQTSLRTKSYHQCHRKQF